MSGTIPGDTITREALAELPIRRYEGPVLLVEDLDTLRQAMIDIHQEAVVGFDTETRPAFRKGEHYPPSLAQVATARAVYVFPLRQTACFPGLAELMEQRHIVKAGVAVAHDLSELAELFPFTPAAVLDLGRVAKRQGITQSGLRNLAGLVLGFRIPKGQQTTNWSAPRLTAAQIQYAATDAWVSRELAVHFAQLGWLNGNPGFPLPP
ncbi:MAG: 3'-5' exonuclease [Pseudomonadota bacterium]